MRAWMGGGGSRRVRAQVRVYGALATLTYVARTGRVPALLAGDLQHAAGPTGLPAGRGGQHGQGRPHPHRRRRDPAAGARGRRRARPGPAVADGVPRRCSRRSRRAGCAPQPGRAGGPDRDPRPEPDVRRAHGARDHRLRGAPLAGRHPTGLTPNQRWALCARHGHTIGRVVTEAAPPDERRAPVGAGPGRVGRCGPPLAPLVGDIPAGALRARRNRRAAGVCGSTQDRHRVPALQPRLHPDRRRARSRLLHRAGGALVDVEPRARHQIPLAGHGVSHRDRAGDRDAAARGTDPRAAPVQGRSRASGRAWLRARRCRSCCSSSCSSCSRSPRR